MTDGDTHTYPEGYGLFWEELDKVVVPLFGESQRLSAKTFLPLGLMMLLARICECIGWVLGVKLKLNVFAVKMLTMHRWFDISAATKTSATSPSSASTRLARHHRVVQGELASELRQEGGRLRRAHREADAAQDRHPDEHGQGEVV